MVLESLTGTRIRERRVLAKMRQAELAAAVGISASYLNLIEHNKRRIGGKLLLDIAATLDCEPVSLSEGAAARLVLALEKAADDLNATEAETDQVQEFAGRFPGWADVISQQHRQIRKLERAVDGLSDRLAHDPQLAASMHDVLSMVTAVRATANILHENREIEPEWRTRFHRNLDEDSARLAESAQALVQFLDVAEDIGARLATPYDAFEAFLREHDFHFPQIEAGETAEAVLSQLSLPESQEAQAMIAAHLRQYAEDAAQMPKAACVACYQSTGGDLGAVAREFRVSLATAMRRIAFLPEDSVAGRLGLLVCNNAGAVLLRKELPDVPLPRYSSTPADWPIFRALSRPMQPIRDQVTIIGRYRAEIDCLAIAEPDGPPQIGRDTLFNSYMILRDPTISVPAGLEAD